MHGDITRTTFDPAKGYSAVRQQQGRVQTDADWNEDRDIALHDQRAARTDVIGPHGAPVGDPGLEVTVDGTDLEIGGGRYYVDGIRVDRPASETLGSPEAAGTFVVHLDVWERPVTAVEDPEIREVALGGPDTATRTQVAARVGLLRVADPAAHCGQALPEWTAHTAAGTGTLSVDTGTTDANPSPCLVPETAGFRGLDNRAYRIQIHRGTVDPRTGEEGAGPATFVWSRDNGAVVASWIAPPTGLDVQVDRLGPGGAEGFVRGALVELRTDREDLAHEPGILTTIDDVTGSTLRLAPFGTDRPSAVAALAALFQADRHPKVRLWDGEEALPLPTAEPVELENGLRVLFSATGTWRSGDFWVVPARTAILPGTVDRQIEWPRGAALPPHGPRRHHARLAVATWDGAAWTDVQDCRELFAPLVDDLQFTARGGDAQVTAPSAWLAAPLVAGVSRGVHPAAGETVRFTVAAGGGALSATEPDTAGATPAGAGTVPVGVGSDGLARVWWRLGPATTPAVAPDAFDPDRSQLVRAELLGPGGTTAHLPLAFRAVAADPLTLTVVGGDGQLGAPGETLEIALRARVGAGGQPAPGQQVRFEIESTMLAGVALDEQRGGSLIVDPADLVSADLWPGGGRAVRAVVRTDDTGIARLQWMLGAEQGLPVQRVSATLLDGAAGQVVLYTAHLAMASEVTWNPCRRLVKAAGENPTVQVALDLFCELLGSIGAFGRVQLTDTTLVAMEPDRVVPIGQWSGRLEVELPIVLPNDPPARAIASALVVTAEVPVEGRWAGAVQSVRLPGTTTVARRESSTQLVWQSTDPRLDAPDVAAGPVLVRLTVLPSLLRSRTEIPWHAAFTVGS